MVPQPSSRRQAFTLLELLVVISIIGLLLIFLIVGLPWVSLDAKRKRTAGFIGVLQAACVSYRETFGAGRDYPPMDRGTGQDPVAGDSSRNLVHYLGRRLTKLPAGGAPGVPLPLAEPQRPFYEFKGDETDAAGCVIDVWGRRILYYNAAGGDADPFAGSAFPGHDALFKDGRVPHLDIVSYGQSETGVDDGQDCRIATWKLR